MTGDIEIICCAEFHYAVKDVLENITDENKVIFTETSNSMIYAEAILEGKIKIKILDREGQKRRWSTGRQRNLRHYPGRRWIDLRTMSK